MENKRTRAFRRQKKVRGKLPQEGYRLTISRSNRYLLAQIIDLKSGRVRLGLSDKKALTDKEARLTKVKKAEEFGRKFAAEALKKKLGKVFFDRGGYRYHGRIKAFIEGTQAGGIKY